MHRLLQGDVGAGKTVVAVAALLIAVQGGHQGAFMAPTEVLAEQHLAGIRPLLDGHRPSPDDGASLFGERPLRGRAAHQPVDRQGAAAASSPGWPTARSTCSIGTHALIQEAVEFRSRSASW